MPDAQQRSAPDGAETRSGRIAAAFLGAAAAGDVRGMEAMLVSDAVLDVVTSGVRFGAEPASLGGLAAALTAGQPAPRFAVDAVIADRDGAACQFRLGDGTTASGSCRPALALFHLADGRIERGLFYLGPPIAEDRS